MSRPLSPLSYRNIDWQGRMDSNHRHAASKAAALPTELHPYKTGSEGWDRTNDVLRRPGNNRDHYRSGHLGINTTIVMRDFAAPAITIGGARGI